MTLPENPISTLWLWTARAPLPVVIALVAVLSSWVYALESRVAEQDTRLVRMEATLAQVDTNVQTLLKAVLWEQTTRKKEIQ